MSPCGIGRRASHNISHASTIYDPMVKQMFLLIFTVTGNYLYKMRNVESFSHLFFFNSTV